MLYSQCFLDKSEKHSWLAQSFVSSLKLKYIISHILENPSISCISNCMPMISHNYTIFTQFYPCISWGAYIIHLPETPWPGCCHRHLPREGQNGHLGLRQWWPLQDQRMTLFEVHWLYIYIYLSLSLSVTMTDFSLSWMQYVYDSILYI